MKVESDTLDHFARIVQSFAGTVGLLYFQLFWMYLCQWRMVQVAERISSTLEEAYVLIHSVSSSDGSEKGKEARMLWKSWSVS